MGFHSSCKSAWIHVKEGEERLSTICRDQTSSASVPGHVTETQVPYYKTLCVHQVTNRECLQTKRNLTERRSENEHLLKLEYRFNYVLFSTHRSMGDTQPVRAPDGDQSAVYTAQHAAW